MLLKLKRYAIRKLGGIPKYDIFLVWNGMNSMRNQFHERSEREEDPEEKKKINLLWGLLDYWQDELRKAMINSKEEQE